MGGALISWLDAAPARFWVVAIGALTLWAIATLAPWRDSDDAVAPARQRGGRGMAAWVLASLLLLLAWRWPYLVGPAILNPDEAQMVAGAITLKSFPVYWKYVDGTTRGPLADAALLLGHALGLPLNNGGARAMAGLLTVGGLLLAARGWMLVFPARAVRIAFAAPIFLWAGSSFYDFTGFTSESVPVFLILASLWPALSGLLRADLAPRARALRLGLAGLALGSLPYAKLQSVPVGLALGLVFLVAAIDRARHAAGRWRWTGPGALVIGALLPTVALVAHLWIWGLWRQFWISYIEHNRAYASQAPYSFWSVFGDLWGLSSMAAGLQSLIVFAGLASVTAFAAGFSRRRRATMPWTAAKPGLRRWREGWTARWPRFTPALSAATAVLLVVSIAAVVAPRRPFAHYLQFLVPPLACLLAIGLGSLSLTVAHRWSRRTRVRAGGLLLLALLVPMVVARVKRPDPDMRGIWTAYRGEWRSPAGLEIRRLALPGDRLCVWGWMPGFYVEAGLPQATREAHTYGQIEHGALREFFRERFLRDFRRSSPRIFVDAVGGANFGYSAPHRATHGHESFPELAAMIAEHYEFVAEVEGSRIYLRREAPAPDAR